MKSFNSFADFSRHLGTLAVIESEHHALEQCGEIVEKAAKAKIGKYQQGAGPFAAWAPLAESTKEDRARLGYPEDEPLLREGTLRDSIEHKVVFPEAHIGSNSEIAVYQELGTKTIPPRSFLGTAVVEETPKLIEVIGRNVF